MSCLIVPCTRFRPLSVLCALLSVIFLIQGCANNPPKPSKEMEDHLSGFEKKELRIGNQIHKQVLSSFYLYTEPHLIEYVNRIGSSLTRHAERKNLRYRFTILLSERIFATSAPGGYVYITTGFLNFLENEAQLAGVLAHEIGQLQYRNPRLSNSKKALDAISVGGTLVGGFFGDVGVLAILGLRAMEVLTDEKSKEARVYEADKLALNYLAAAGYDPECWMDVLYKFLEIKEHNAADIFDYYNARPITIKRLQKLKNKFQKVDIGGKSLETGGEIYLEETKGVKEIYRTVQVV